MTGTQLPELRAVDCRPIIHGGQRSILLRDPLQLSNKTVIIPQPLAPILALCDGTRDLGALQASLTVRFGLRIRIEVLEQLVTAMDSALLLDNERFAQAQEQALTAYRQAPFRAPNGAGRSYPADANELRQALDGYLEAVDDERQELTNGRGLVSPHIDYARGGPVYAAVWKQAAAMAQEADLVVLLGTDHFGTDGRLTLTRQHYATPFGVLPTAQGLVDALAQAMGEEAAFGGELLHRSEHSIELAAVWLHHVRHGRPCDLLPILCGSFSRFVQGDARPAQDPTIEALIDELREALMGRRTLVVAAADLSHVGPAFGGRPQGLVERGRLQAADDVLIKRMCAGDAEGFFAAIKGDNDRYNVCGLPPIYLALRLLSPAQGGHVAYDRCPADQDNTSWVTVCGVVFN